MRELERDLSPTPTPEAPIVIIGRGRVGRSLAPALEAAGISVRLVGADETAASCAGATAAILCVPDAAIESVCARIASANPPPALVGHVSGASTLAVLTSAAERGAATFSLHPLQTFGEERTPLQGVPGAVAGSDGESEGFASALAERLGMRPFRVDEEQRAAYHAAASVASNFLVALEESAADLLARAGVEDARELLAPLVLRTAANWAQRGGEALTGPIARGDAATIERHRAALTEIAPELLSLYDVLAERTESLASEAKAAESAAAEEVRA